MVDWNIGCWNVRGLDSSLKYEEINRFTTMIKIALMGILETRIRHTNKDLLDCFVHRGWSIHTNLLQGHNIRIVVLWKASDVEVEIADMTDQLVHCRVRDKGGKFKGFVIMVYPSNDINERRIIWSRIK